VRAINVGFAPFFQSKLARVVKVCAGAIPTAAISREMALPVFHV
jgi:hypothetical protein